jgi:hypothetical protein
VAQGSVVLLPVSFLVPPGWCSSDLSCCRTKDLILSSVQDLLSRLASGFIHVTCFISHRQLCSYKQVKVAVPEVRPLLLLQFGSLSRSPKVDFFSAVWSLLQIFSTVCIVGLL